MRARVLGCCTIAGGEVEAPPSTWEAYLKLGVGAIAGKAVVEGVVGRSRHIGSFLDFLRQLGFTVFRAGGRVELEFGGMGRPRVFLAADAGLHVVAVGLAVASRYLRPPQQLIVRAQWEPLLNANLKPLMELAHTLGLKAWPGGSLSRLLIVEPTSPKPPSAPLRLTTTHAYVLAAALLAAASYGGAVFNSYGFSSDRLQGVRRLQAAQAVLREAGLRLEASGSGSVVRTEPLEGSRVALRVKGGYAEALTLLALAAACNAVENIRVKGLPRTQWGYELDFDYLAKSMMYNVKLSCTGDTCEANVEREPNTANPSIAYSVRDTPDLIAPLAAYIAIAGQGSISGLTTVEAELPQARQLEATLQKLGVEAYLEDEGDRLTAMGLTEETSTTTATSTRYCGEPPAACLASIARMLAKCRGQLEGVEVLEDYTPGLLEQLLATGLPLDIA